MEDLISQFSILSNQSLMDKNFDPTTIEDLMKLFEIEAYKSWAALELECQEEVDAAHDSMAEAEDELNSAMKSAMEEFRSFEEEMEREAMAEYHSLVSVGEAARKMGKTLENAATVAANKYIETALRTATKSVRSAWKGISSHKVHPS